MTVPQPITQTIAPVVARHWLAQLRLGFAKKHHKTRLVDNAHFGPLRVQRPFYPEVEDCCHIYLLHPPGGMVLGDRLEISARLEPDTNVLITTPAAGKVYGVNGLKPQQIQHVSLHVEENSLLEWLPQETIVFNGANTRLLTTLNLQGEARACLWDMVCLGRPASEAPFTQGRCDQTLEIIHDGRTVLLERNRFVGGSALLKSPWGLAGAHTSGTFLATANASQQQVDDLLAWLHQVAPAPQHRWGVTQKGPLFIVRYIGHSSRLCRLGFEHIWRLIRPSLRGREAVTPRIWNT